MVSPLPEECPRFTETQSYAENFNNNQPVIVTNYAPVSETFTVPGAASEAAMMIKVKMPNHPNNAVSKTYVGASGWREGLPLVTLDCISDDCTGTDRKRWTWTNWTQDDSTKNYIVNPRVTESKVGDATNTKRTTVDYQLLSGSNVSIYGRVTEVKVYDSDQTTVLKRSATVYSDNGAYTGKRLIALPLESDLYEGMTTLVSKVTYDYDNPDGFTGTEQNISPIQHDNTNYGASFVAGRGNLTSTTRWDVNSPLNASLAVKSSVKYNTAGGVVSQTDPLNRTVTISYADVFNDTTVTRNTYAYPTKLTDPSSNFSEVKYRFDIGANVWARSPMPQGTTTAPNTQGKTSERIFDSVGRLEKQKIVNNGAYTRYEYPSNGVQSKVFTTITAGEGEAVSQSWMDGAGRVRQSISSLPGSSGGWSGSKIEYDILGRAKRQTVPTDVTLNETTSIITPTGEDNRGNDLQGNPIWLWTSQRYDWKGRVTRKINTDGVDSDVLNDSDILIDYEGCGCAGGQVTTIKGEKVPREDDPNTTARRTQKVYEDILGRTYKTEMLNWNETVYSSTITRHNGRDQAEWLNQYTGNAPAFTETTPPDNLSCPLGTCQQTKMTYDGHARLKTRHLPEQDTTAVTTYNYNVDDSIQSVVDGRGASTNYTYSDPRGLLTNISYSGLGLPPTPSVLFGYDNAGNRISMTDGFGSAAYAYNELSQMTSETRQFSDTLANAPVGGFNLTYDYTLSGQLKSLKDPFGQQFNYAFDKVGRLSSVTGATAFAGVSSYASSPSYRAWGGLKNLTYGNGLQMAQTFDNRVQTASYSLTGANNTTMQKAYQYYADGQLKFVQDVLNPVFNRLNIYDQAGRIKYAKSGAEASGGTATGHLYYTLPYRQTYGYDAFGNMTQRDNLNWGYSQVNGLRNFNLSYAYQNNRVVGNIIGHMTPTGAIPTVLDRMKTPPQLTTRRAG